LGSLLGKLPEVGENNHLPLAGSQIPHLEGFTAMVLRNAAAPMSPLRCVIQTVLSFVSRCAVEGVACYRFAGGG
jgi:hypothetical protein